MLTSLFYNVNYLYGVSILNRWKDYYSQLLNVYRFSDIRHIEMHIAEALIIDPSPFEPEIAIAMLESYTCKILIKFLQNWFKRSRDSVVGIATGYGLGRPRGRSSSPCWVKNFLFSTSSRPALGPTQPSIQWVPGDVFPGVKRQGRETDHSPPASAEVKKIWICKSTSPYVLMAQCLIS
jgi:hypothetical protein